MVENIEKKFWKVPVPLTGNGFFMGRIGSAKSCKMLSIAQGYHSHGYKLLDIFGGLRDEGPFWCFKSEEKKLWDELEVEVGTFKTQGPKEYEVNLLIPMFSSKLPKQLPESLPRITTKVFTIPISSIDISDISLVVGDLSSNSRYLWNSLVKKVGEEGNGADIEHLMKTKFKGYQNLAVYKLFIKPLIDNHLLSNDLCSMNLDVQEEIKNKNAVSVLMHKYIPEQFRFFIMGWILRQSLKLAMEDKVHKKTIAMFREASAFMKVQDKSSENEEQTQIFRNHVSNIARYARSGLFLFMDTQSPAEVKGLIEGQDDLLGINEMPSMKDREEVCEQLRKDGRISKAQIRYIATMPIHEMFLVTRGKKAKLLRRVAPPRTQFWKSNLGNFESYWKKTFNKYKNTNQEMESIRKEYLHHKYLLDEKENQKTEMQKVEKVNKIDSAIIKVEVEQAQRMLEEPVQLL